MSGIRQLLNIALISLSLVQLTFALTLDQSPSQPGQWGYRPADQTTSAVNPPSFSWRPQKNVTWELQISPNTNFQPAIYSATQLEFNVHCPTQTFNPGRYYWRYRAVDKNSAASDWSQIRSFTITPDSVAMPMPPRAELLRRIPTGHPRLFLRPENLNKLRTLAQGSLKPQYDKLIRTCDNLLKNPPDTTEPPLYPKDIVRNSDPWREIWWGNRTYTIKALDSAATLAFTRLLGGPEKYGQEARRILMECAKWDPKGSTGYRYNDEAGMPYNYYFSRTYSFVNDLLSDEEKAICRQVMKIRGEEMYRFLCPSHLWQPYSSHSNRAWHFLGEVAIAFMGEIEGAEDWLWFAMNVFYNTYPVWCDDDGGWHEGSSYWSSYQARFTWWADVMREAMGIDAFDKPYYSQVGYYMLYLMPPGKIGGGFGDLCADKTSRSFREIMTIFTTQAGNSNWQWWVDQNGGPVETGGYIGFIRGALPAVRAAAPTDLPTSRLFAGIGQAYLNSQIFDAQTGTQIAFKSSPFGTQSHGYEANNSFLLSAYGKRLLIRSGKRDSYGSEHHSKWMWSTRSVNNITVNGKGQGFRTSKAQGNIEFFQTTPAMDLVIGEAGSAYLTPLDQFRRAIIFVKPDLMIVYDRLRAREPSEYQYWLHAINKMDIIDQHQIIVRNDEIRCDIDFLYPAGLTFAQTDQYDPNPRPRVTLREWHLTASTPQKNKQMEFITVYRIGKGDQPIPVETQLTRQSGSFTLEARLPNNTTLTATLPTIDTGKINLKLAQPGKTTRITED